MGAVLYESFLNGSIFDWEHSTIGAFLVGRTWEQIYLEAILLGSNSTSELFYLETFLLWSSSTWEQFYLGAVLLGSYSTWEQF